MTSSTSLEIRHLGPEAGVSPEERGHLEALGALVLDPPELDAAVIGVMEDRVVYDHHLLVQTFMKVLEAEYEEALEWVCYNTLRSLPYHGDKAPIVLYEVIDEEMLDEDEVPLDFLGRVWVRES